MDKKDLDFFKMAAKFPKLNEFCRKHNINWKIENIEYVCNSRLVTFRFVKDGFDSVVRRYGVNNEFETRRAENILILDLCEMGFDAPYLSFKKFNYSSMAFDPKTNPFIREIVGCEVKKTNNMKIKNVIFQDPATIVFWEDGTKTVVRAEGEGYDPEKGLAMAISRKALGNNRDYYNTFIHWLKRYKKNDDWDWLKKHKKKCSAEYEAEYKEVLKKLEEMCKDE